MLLSSVICLHYNVFKFMIFNKLHKSLSSKKAVNAVRHPESNSFFELYKILLEGTYFTVCDTTSKLNK